MFLLVREQILRSLGNFLGYHIEERRKDLVNAKSQVTQTPGVSSTE